MGERYILCVDDEAIITISLRRELQSAFPLMRVESANSGESALELVKEILEDDGELVVLVTDERMPGMQGHVLLREIRQILPRLRGILLTGYTDIDAIASAVNEAGLFRYIHKPWEKRDLAMAVSHAIELYDREKEAVELRNQVEKLNVAVVAALENSAHEGDPDTYSHVQRVACYSALLASGLGLASQEIRRIHLYAPLHDIGKSGIPHAILFKPGRLTQEEFAVVKKHVEIGASLLKTVDVDSMARDIILYHHENWDGKGYLAELSGEAIPMSARIVALADVLDAMLSERPYKSAMPFDEVAAEIRSLSGSRFDPAVVQSFDKNIDVFKRIHHGERPDLCIGYPDLISFA